MPAKPKSPLTKPGDLWHLGRHRILCGDATDPASWGRLTKDLPRAAVVFTDPPYGVSYEARSGKFEMIAGDELRDDGLVKKLLKPALVEMARQAKDTAAFYIWHASSTREDFAYAMKAAGLVERQYLFWAKTQIVLGHSDYRWAHEPCFYASKDGKKPDFYGDRGEPSYWRAGWKTSKGESAELADGVVLTDGRGGKLLVTPKVPKGKKLRTFRLEAGQSLQVEAQGEASTVWHVAHDKDAAHPTQKPVELARRAIMNSSQVGELVVDGFMGSGTTLMGAEATKRIAAGMELDPGYCDVIVKRWQDATGMKAERTPFRK